MESNGGYGSCFTACDIKYSYSIRLSLWLLCTPAVAFGVQSEIQFAVSNLQQSSISPRAMLLCMDIATDLLSVTIATHYHTPLLLPLRIEFLKHFG